MKYPKITLYIDLLFCIVILPLIIMLVPIDKWITNQTFFVITLIVYLYALYFVYRKANIPALFMQHKYGRIALLIVALLTVTELLAYFPLPEIPHSKLPQDFRRHLHAQTVWFFFLIVSGFSLAIELTFELFRQMFLKQEIEARKNKAELALYKAQINPHFLFNSLNSLSALITTDPALAEEFVLKLSKVYRYVLEKRNETLASVKEELDFTRHYYFLQKIRFWMRHCRSTRRLNGTP